MNKFQLLTPVSENLNRLQRTRTLDNFQVASLHIESTSSCSKRLKVILRFHCSNKRCYLTNLNDSPGNLAWSLHVEGWGSQTNSVYRLYATYHLLSLNLVL